MALLFRLTKVTATNRMAAKLSIGFLGAGKMATAHLDPSGVHHYSKRR
ncbi:MAG: hypothetical protein ABI042_14095 [Verrucomicrobiota bacterium]